MSLSPVAKRARALSSLVCGWGIMGKRSYFVASSRSSMGFRKTGFEDRQAAMVNIGSRHWKTVARTSIWEALTPEPSFLDEPDSLSLDGGREEAKPREPVRKSGRSRDDVHLTMYWPRAVRLPSWWMAPSSSRIDIALSIAATFGGSIALLKNC